MSLYDRLFKPRRYTLPNGTVVEEKRSRAPLVILIVLALGALSVHITGFDFAVLVKKGGKFFDILTAMFPPNTGYLAKIWQPLWDTVKMSFLGSFVGAVLAIPFAIAAASNIVTNRVVVFIVRLFLSLVRTLPTLVCALIATYIFGLGTMAGTCAIAVFTFAYVGKQLSRSSKRWTWAPTRRWRRWAPRGCRPLLRRCSRRCCLRICPYPCSAWRAMCAMRRSWAMWAQAAWVLS